MPARREARLYNATLLHQHRLNPIARGEMGAYLEGVERSLSVSNLGMSLFLSTEYSLEGRLGIAYHGPRGFAWGAAGDRAGKGSSLRVRGASATRSIAPGLA